MVKAEVLYKSWLLDEAELTFIQKLREAQRNEMRGRVKNTTPDSPSLFCIENLASGFDLEPVLSRGSGSRVRAKQTLFAVCFHWTGLVTHRP